MMLNAVKTDLAIRTGKATLRLEEAAAELKKDDNKAAKTETMAADTVSDVQSEIAGLAMAAAAKVVDNNLDENANKKYLDEFLNEAGGKK